MEKNYRKILFAGILIIMLFALWTTLVICVDVSPAGSRKTPVGFSVLNSFVHNCTGVNMVLYFITDWLSLIPAFIVGLFGLLGLSQWIKRKSVFKVDLDILLLGFFYMVVMAVYIGFEIFVVNYRPILINGILEASYPSSTTVLTLCVMATAAVQRNYRLKNDIMKKYLNTAITVFSVFMVGARFISGVHWFTDIVGGILFSTGLVMIYTSLCNWIYNTKK